MLGITKCDKKLLQSATDITNGGNYYKVITDNVNQFGKGSL